MKNKLTQFIDRTGLVARNEASQEGVSFESSLAPYMAFCMHALPFLFSVKIYNYESLVY
jgi:hypothetical protein